MAVCVICDWRAARHDKRRFNISPSGGGELGNSPKKDGVRALFFLVEAGEKICTPLRHMDWIREGEKENMSWWRSCAKSLNATGALAKRQVPREGHGTRLG